MTLEVTSTHIDLASMASLKRSSAAVSAARRSLAPGSSRTGAIVGARQVSSEAHHDEHHSASDHLDGTESTYVEGLEVPSPNDGTIR